ncbi:hypothetical protein GF385_01550 [Candidatus Dependentiae bacterium]|nr:hypothetical protein [Candidatus Dependentiae bacterium]
MDFLILIIFLQIILESLPISSSGHLDLFSKILNFNIPEYLEYFLHGPTIIVLMIVFYKDWFYLFYFLLKGIFERLRLFIGRTVRRFGIAAKIDFTQNSVTQKISKYSYSRLLKIFTKILLLVFVANVITTFIWFFRKHFLINKFLINSNLILFFGFCITAIFLFSLKLNLKRTININILFKFMILGIVQGVALLPGVSRFASVYASARLLKIPQRRAFQITFLLQFPLILAGFFLGLNKMIKISSLYKIFNLPIFIGILFATIISIFILFLCKRLAKNNKLWCLGFYMSIPILILFCWIIYI